MSLPIFVADSPLSGVKIARLVLDNTQRVSFAPTYPRAAVATYSAQDKAACAVYGSHEAPHEKCSCGFYAVQDISELARLCPVPSSVVVLHARFGGRVILHELGLRAQLQSIDTVQLPAVCAWCEAGTPSGFRVRFSVGREKQILPVCVRCFNAATPRRRRTLQEVATDTGCSVSDELCNVSYLQDHEQSKPFRPLTVFATTVLPAGLLALLSSNPVLSVAVVALGIAAAVRVLKFSSAHSRRLIRLSARHFSHLALSTLTMKRYTAEVRVTEQRTARRMPRWKKGV